MSSLNKVFLLGNLTRNPELRYTPSGTSVCEFALAVSRKFAKDGQQQEETCFVDIVIFGKIAETSNRYLSKGSPVLIEGRLQFDQWEDRQTGKRLSKLKVVGETVQFLGSKRDDNGGNQAPPQQRQSQGRYGAEDRPQPGIPAQGEYREKDDIPF